MSQATGGESSKSSEDGDCSSSSDSSSGHLSRVQKQKMRVWNRVAWFSKKQRHRDELSAKETDAEIHHSPKAFANSEIVEQNCLRPSVARALFMQLEASGGPRAEEAQQSWWKKSKAALSLSMPDGVDEGHACHCVACCSCSPSQRLLGSCPAFSFIRRSSSAASLDSVLAGITCEQPCPEKQNLRLLEGSHLTESSTDPPAVHDDSSKTNSLPTYLSRDILKKCANCDELVKLSHLPASPNHRSIRFCLCKQKQKKESVLQDSSYSFHDKLQLMTEWFHDFNDAQRNLLLKQLLPRCSVPQIHFLSTALENHLHAGCPPNCMDGLGWLPNTITSYLLTFLDPVSLCRASMTCRRWNELASDPALWRRFCNQPKWRLSKVGEQKQLLQYFLPNGGIDWKSVFAERFKLCNNWLKARCNVRTFEGHTQGISCVQFDDTRIVSGSSDKTIKVWNIRTNSPWGVQTLAGHSGTVRCLHLEGNRLVSGSTDCSIKVWDLSTQQSWSSIACKVTMVGHLDTVRCLQVDDEKVVSGSYDRCLKVWDIRTGQCRMSLRGHEEAVLCVQFDQHKIISGSCDKTIKVWSFSGQCLMTLQGHHDAVTCLQFDQTRIISGSLDCTLKFWHIDTGTCIKTIDWKASEGHTGVVRCLQADSWRVVSASDDRTIKVWNLETGQRLVTLRNHTDGVTCLQFNDSVIVSGSYDKTVKLWDFGCC